MKSHSGNISGGSDKAPQYYILFWLSLSEVSVCFVLVLVLNIFYTILHEIFLECDFMNVSFNMSLTDNETIHHIALSN